MARSSPPKSPGRTQVRDRGRHGDPRLLRLGPQQHRRAPAARCADGFHAQPGSLPHAHAQQPNGEEVMLTAAATGRWPFLSSRRLPIPTSASCPTSASSPARFNSDSRAFSSLPSASRRTHQPDLHPARQGTIARGAPGRGRYRRRREIGRHRDQSIRSGEGATSWHCRGRFILNRFSAVAVAPKTKADSAKMGPTLQRITEEDPTLSHALRAGHQRDDPVGHGRGPY